MKTQFIGWDEWIKLSTYRQYDIQLELVDKCRELESKVDELEEQIENLKEMFGSGKDSFMQCQEKADMNSEL